jgi:membrane protein
LYFVRFVLFCTDTVNDFLRKNCPYIAAAISFYALFSFFPLVLAIISIAGYVYDPSPEEQIQLAKDIAEVIPVSTDAIRGTIEGVVSARAITGIASVLGLLWASTAAFGAVRKGINAAWGITRTRPFLRERMMDFSLVLGAGVLMMFILLYEPIFTFFTEAMDYIRPEGDVAGDFLLNLANRILNPLLTFISFLLLYRFLPNTKVQLSDVWLSALVTAAAFEGTKWGFVWYVTTFPVYNVVYGTVGAIMALLTWVYVSAIILLFGALVASRYASYPSRVRGEKGLKLILTGLTRVRVRVVASAETR